MERIISGIREIFRGERKRPLEEIPEIIGAFLTRRDEVAGWASSVDKRALDGWLEKHGVERKDLDELLF